ncbi:MAG: AAA family ATPase [Alphaproteobacteria bacterium]|nr:AAA family ATPase [Alphaproteobacteria bacterium]
MADNNDRLDLIQRLAEKQARDNGGSLAERAAQKLAVNTEVPPPASGPMPVAPSKEESFPKSAAVQDIPKTETESEDESPSKQNRYAALDLERLSQAGFVTPNSQQTHTAEEFRAVKRPLLLGAFGTGKSKIERGNVILVTSSKPGEGKTFVSINLALSIASERDLHVLVIDTDVYRRRLESELGIDDDRGLVDMLLEDDLHLPDLLIRTNIPNLSILPVGIRNPQAPELLSSQKMATLMADIAARYPDRVIIIDSPPILASSEASVLAMLVGQIVMVVEANKTDSSELQQALKLINTCENINFVINKSGSDSGSSPYGSYSYYDEYRQKR